MVEHRQFGQTNSKLVWGILILKTLILDMRPSILVYTKEGCKSCTDHVMVRRTRPCLACRYLPFRHISVFIGKFSIIDRELELFN